MKDSGVEWIGEIPVEWNCSKIKHHFKIGSGTTPKSDIPSYWDGDIVWITPADFKTDDVYVSEGHRNLTQEGFESSTLEIIPAGNIIFSKRAPIGQVVINSVDLCTNQGCLTAVPLDKSNVKYYRYAMSVATSQFELAGSGTTFKEISATAFGNFILPSPNVSEQKKITEYLDRKCSSIDSVIMKQQVIIEKLKEYKLSVITETMNRGATYSSKYIDTGNDWYGKIHPSFQIRRLKFLCSKISDGTHFSPQTTLEGYPYITAGDVNGKGVDYLSAKKVSSESYFELVKQGCRPEKGDVLIVKDGATTGRVGLMIDNEECVILSSVAMLHPASDVDSEYLMYLMMSEGMQKQIQLSMAGSAMPRTTLTKLMDYYGLWAPVQEQKAIVAHLNKSIEKIDKQIKNKNRLIETLQEYKKSLIYEVVTGKREVYSCPTLI